MWGESVEKRCVAVALLTVSLVLTLYGCVGRGKNDGQKLNRCCVINVDGDVSLAEDQNRIYWNPHSVGLTDASTWNVTFKNETEIFLKTSVQEAGHVAAGAWWTTSFKSKEKLQLSKAVRLSASFRINIVKVHHQPSGEWLRMALACALQRGDGSVVYTEMDFWDSPNTLRHPSGNVGSGGNVVYWGGDVVEYKVDQAEIGVWKNYSLDLTGYVDSAWSIRPGDVLESVYVVVEAIGAVEVDLKVDDLWITICS
jgi:hypothetical protein